jgi:hypothetical protein
MVVESGQSGWKEKRCDGLSAARKRWFRDHFFQIGLRGPEG